MAKLTISMLPFAGELELERSLLAARFEERGVCDFDKIDPGSDQIMHLVEIELAGSHGLHGEELVAHDQASAPSSCVNLDARCGAAHVEPRERAISVPIHRAGIRHPDHRVRLDNSARFEVILAIERIEAMTHLIAIPHARTIRVLGSRIGAQAQDLIGIARAVVIGVALPRIAPEVCLNAIR